MTENEKIGAWLVEKRKKYGKTQQNIADRLGVTAATVSRWEGGQRTIYAKDFINYCNAIGLSSDEMQEITKL